ncbi:MAG: ABC transporter ATP-binding protein [Chloroflexi bacterium]|nr:ABC transporter ATP-binding protein [Chloroflexota bacterium]MDA1147495.1 ABC transporter ATP-binding protein [Chloroflexota bacterium]
MTIAPDRAIEVTGLRKRYGDFEAVRGIDFHVDRAEVFALLGPNGAGKTTTVEILEGHRDRDGGTVNVLGYDPHSGGSRFRERIGIVLQSTGVEPYLTVEETLRQFRGFYPHPRPLDEILEVVGLTAQRATRVRRLSGGQQRRLDVAVGLAGDPDLLFLDEPTTGFDPAARRQAWELVHNLKALGKTVLLTTHYMDEAQQLADRLAIIVAGSIVAEGTPAELMSRDHLSTIEFKQTPAATALIAGVSGEVALGDGLVSVRTSEPTRALAMIAGRAEERGIELEDLSVTRATLEDVYLQLAADPATTPADLAAPAAGAAS